MVVCCMYVLQPAAPTLTSKQQHIATKQSFAGATSLPRAMPCQWRRTNGHLQGGLGGHNKSVPIKLRLLASPPSFIAQCLNGVGLSTQHTHTMCSNALKLRTFTQATQIESARLRLRNKKRTTEQDEHRLANAEMIMLITGEAPTAKTLESLFTNHVAAFPEQYQLTRRNCHGESGYILPPASTSQLRQFLNKSLL